MVIPGLRLRLSAVLLLSTAFFLIIKPMSDLDFGQRLLHTRETSRNYPNCIFILTGYGGLLLLTSLLIIQLQLPDSLLYFFLIPCVLGAFFSAPGFTWPCRGSWWEQRSG
jgi:hypothetical protein